MKKLFVIVFDNELEFDELADKIGNRFINSDNAIEYCGSWGKIMFNNLISQLWKIIKGKSRMIMNCS